MNALNTKPQDSELVRVIRERIRWDKRVSLADLDITVRQGIVIVNGYVDSMIKKNAALGIISEIEGVWKVEDRIAVPSDYYRSDEEITKILESQVSDLIKVGGEHIELEVAENIVLLHGEVYRPRMKAMAGGMAWELSGVQDVLNFIEVKDPPRRIALTLGFEHEPLVSQIESAGEDNHKEVS